MTEREPPSGSPAAVESSMFKNAQGVNISGGSFSINVNAENGQRLKVLHNRVAPNAILNASGRADEVRCHPGTRKELIDRIEKWGDGYDGQTEPMFWLSGPAGAGKSSIVQTVAERCKERQVPCASFFFFRGDTTRSHASPLVATIVYQIISKSLYPSLNDPIATLLDADPLILDSNLDDQLTRLIVEPLCAIQQSFVTDRRLLILIDGLDECDSESKLSQQQILLAFDKVLAQYGEACPFRVLVASRAESQIQMGFNKITSHCIRLFLDEKYSPEKDIRVFVNAKFDEVRRTHSLANMLNANWPSIDDVTHIVEKSSGQFIYGATVMRFILDSSANPEISLERVKGAARLATKSPFSHLDAIYTYILFEVDDQQSLKDILHAQLLSNTMYQYNLHKFLEVYNQNYSKATLVSCMADLTSIARYDNHNGILEFFHASFPDFLLDKSRSGAYFVDLSSFNRIVMPILWKYDQELRVDLRQLAVKGTLLLEPLLPNLLNIVVACKAWSQLGDFHPSIFVKFYEMCVTDNDLANFRTIFHQWITKYHINYDYRHYRAIQCIQFTDRYIQMHRAERNWDLGPPDSGATAALHSKTDDDRNELGVWLEDILSQIYSEVYSQNATKYKELLRTWIYWAVANGVRINDLDLEVIQPVVSRRRILDMPYSDRYLAMARMDLHQPPDDKITAALHLESDTDREEVATWVKDLMQQIFSKIYPHNPEGYKRLMKAWISWAFRNNIPCQSLESFPGAEKYIWRSKARSWAASKLGLAGGK